MRILRETDDVRMVLVSKSTRYDLCIFEEKDVNDLLRQLTGDPRTLTRADLHRVAMAGGLIFVREKTGSGHDGRIIGMARLSVIEGLTGRKGLVDDVVIDQGCRGHGHGRMLMGAIIELARTWGLDRLELTSTPSRVSANALYVSLGFDLRDTNAYRLKL